jgi:hypothetical protein
MSWVQADLASVAFLVDPNGRILQGEWHHDIILDRVDAFPDDLQDRVRQIKAISVRDYRRADEEAWEIVRELVGRGWCRGRWEPGTELNLMLGEDRGEATVEQVLTWLPVEMLDVATLFLEFLDGATGITVHVDEGEDALEAYKKRRTKTGWRYASHAYTWAELKVLVPDLGVSYETLYRTMGGPEENPSYHEAWAWLEAETEPEEVTGFLRFEFGKDLPMPDRNRVYEEEHKKTMEKTYTPERFQTMQKWEWMDIADLPALPSGTPPTEQEKRVGISIRQTGKGAYLANDLWGWGFQARGGRPREALAEIYTQMGGRLPYHV